MNILKRAFQLYADHSDAGFADDLMLHMQHGYVRVTPTVLAMARPVSSKWSNEEMSDISKVDEDGDCWFIWVLVGSLGDALEMLPSEKKWLAFARGGQPRLVPVDRIRSLRSSHERSKQLRITEGS